MFLAQAHLWNYGAVSTMKLNYLVQIFLRKLCVCVCVCVYWLMVLVEVKTKYYGASLASFVLVGCDFCVVLRDEK